MTCRREVLAMDTLLLMLESFSAWILLYCLCCVLQPSLPHAWHIRVVTVIHAFTVVTLSAWCLLVQGPWVFTDPGGPNTPLQHLTVIICLTYFLFDFCWCLYFRTEGAFMLFHHMLSLAGTSLTLYCGKYGTELVATIFGTEITNPFLQLRWFLRQTGHGTRWYAELNDFFFMFLFGSVRIVLGGYLLYCYLSHPVPDWLGRLGGVSMYIVSWVFWVMIVQYAVKKYVKMLKHYQMTTAGHSAESQNCIIHNGKLSTHDSITSSQDVYNGHVKCS